LQSELKLVLLPGMDGTGRLFTGFIEALPGSFETITVRYPAEDGISDKDLDGIVRTACQISGPFILLAESYSTPLAIRYAASNPGNLCGLVLCAGFATSPLQGWKRFLGGILAPIIFRFALPNLAAKRWLIGPDARSSLLKMVRATVSSVKPEVLASRLQSVLACDVRAEMGKVAVPILYLQAKQDRLVNARCLEEIRRIKPGVEIAAIDGPHLLLQREPNKAAEAIIAFIRSLSSPAAR
jgi:pimeloyl-[acyl-carrier protein] methyl ester esterase